MKREIKFRAWHLLNEAMLYEGWNGEAFFTIRDLFYYGESAVLQQFTGLQDKNGKEIYEGDVLQYPRYYDTPEMSSNPLEHDHILFKDGAFRFNIGDGFLFEEMGAYDGDMEVIGNVFEHPELIQKEAVS